MTNYYSIEAAKDEAWKQDLSWLAMDASGELWAGNYKPAYHEYHPIWIWIDDINPVKIGYIYPIENWRDCIWETTS